MAPAVAALQALRGVALVVAATLVAEVGDLTRFANPRQLMAHLGLVPREHSSGASKRRGGITKTGNGDRAGTAWLRLGDRARRSAIDRLTASRTATDPSEAGLATTPPKAGGEAKVENSRPLYEPAPCRRSPLNRGSSATNYGHAVTNPRIRDGSTWLCP